eukprot:2323795-Rhodomonas_salina.1
MRSFACQVPAGHAGVPPSLRARPPPPLVPLLRLPDPLPTSPSPIPTSSLPLLPQSPPHLPTQSPLLTYLCFFSRPPSHTHPDPSPLLSLRPCYTMLGTEVGYGATRGRARRRIASAASRSW